MEFALMLTQDEAFVTYIDVAFETGQNFQYCQKTWCNGIDDEYGAAYVITGPQDETQRARSRYNYSNAMTDIPSNTLASQIDGTGGQFFAGANPDIYRNDTEFSWDWDTSDCYTSCVEHGIVPKPDYPCRCRYKTDMTTGAHIGEIKNTAYFEPRGRPWYYVVPAAGHVRSWTHVYMFTTGKFPSCSRPLRQTSHDTRPRAQVFPGSVHRSLSTMHRGTTLEFNARTLAWHRCRKHSGTWPKEPERTLLHLFSRRTVASWLRHRRASTSRMR